jgi:predicted DNA-binding antitoxin AbrB/MazE fold protein
MQIIEAIYDGKVLHPNDPLTLKPNTRVRLTIEIMQSTKEKALSFLNTARSLSLEGPPDWAEHLDAYLYGRENSQDE